jgi:hypothetical protein
MIRRIAFATALLAAGTSPAHAAKEPRTLSGERPAADIKALRLDARVGEVRVRVGDDDTVAWKVTLEAERGGWFSSLKDARKAIAQAAVEEQVSGTRLLLATRFPSGTDEDEIREHWEVSVPARFAVDIDMAVGELRIEGVAGGVDADLAVGEMRIDVPAGRIRADVSVGEILIDTATPSPGDIELDANVGDVNLLLKGYQVPDERDFGPGAEIDLERDGADDIEASVNVGDVRVKIK